jgi:3-hydroxybutyryl-CoA dehydrogenase
MTATASEIRTVAVVGGGLMGSGIAEAVASAGLEVILRDIDDAGVERAHERIEGSLQRGVRGGKLDENDAAAIRDRIALTTDVARVADADLVVEAVPEDERLKLEVIAAIGQAVSERAIIASNTSSIPITQLAHVVTRPERVVGLHFFSPVPVMRLVEIVIALDTDRETVDAVRAFAIALGKTPIETKDRSGFIVNMLLVPYLMAAVRMFEDGFATREDIDAGMQLGCGHPMGPLTLSDFIGLDVLYAIGVSLYDEFKRDEYAPPPLLKRMVASGRLGRKSGRGFYEYS